MKKMIIASVLVFSAVLSLSAHASNAKVIICDKNTEALSNQFAQSWHPVAGQHTWMSHVDDIMSGQIFSGSLSAKNDREPRDKNPHLMFLSASVFESHDMHAVTCHYRIVNPEIVGHRLPQELIMTTHTTETCRVIKQDVVVCG